MQPENAISKINKGKDKKNDAMMLMAPFANWDRFLAPAPSAIAILGELLMISTKTEFDLRERMPIGGFKYIKYPDSFRACLLQVTNSGWRAFNEAHTCMDQIRLTSSNVDTHVRDAVRILMGGTETEIQLVLPMILQNVEQIANDSLELAQNIETQFLFVMNLTEELLEASTATKSLYDKKAQDKLTQIEVAKIEQDRAEMVKKERQKRFENMEKQVSKAQDDYEKAINEMPDTLKLLGLSFTEGMIDSVKAITSLPADVVRGFGSNTYDLMKGVIVGGKSAKSNAHEKPLNVRIAEFNVLGYVSNINVFISKMEVYIGKPGTDPDTKAIREGMAVIKESLASNESNVQQETDSGDIGKRVFEVCKNGKKICEKAEVMFKSLLQETDSFVNDLQMEVAELKKETMTLVAIAKQTLGRNPLDEQSPCLQTESVTNQSGIVMKTTLETVRFKTELAKENLRDIRNRTEAADQQLDQANERLCEALKTMKTLKIETIEFDEIRKTLQEGISALAEVRAQWGQMVVFFEEIANCIRCCMNTSLKRFVKTIDAGRQVTEKGAVLSQAFRANMYDQTLHASRISYVVSTMAGTYVSISRDHLMGQVTNLAKLMGLDPEKDKTKIHTERMALHDECERAQEAITKKIKKQREEYEAAIDRRINQIETEVEAIMPPPENLEEIQNAVKAGFTEQNANDAAVKAGFTEQDVDDAV